jgi:hypothetical protein
VSLFNGHMHGAACGVDSTPSFGAYVDDPGGVNYHVVGWLDGNGGSLTSSTDHSVSASGAYETVDVSADVSADANFAFLEFDPGTLPEQYAIRPTGESHDDYHDIAEHGYPFVELDGNKQFEQKAEETSNNTWLLAYGETASSTASATATPATGVSSVPSAGVVSGSQTVTATPATGVSSVPSAGVQSPGAAPPTTTDQWDEYLAGLAQGSYSQVDTANVGLYYQTDDSLTGARDMTDLNTEPSESGTGYAAQTVTLSTETTLTVGSETSLSLPDVTFSGMSFGSETLVDAYYVSLSVQLDGDGSAVEHLMAIGNLTGGPYDLQSNSTLTLSDISLSTDDVS